MHATIGLIIKSVTTPNLRCFHHIHYKDMMDAPKFNTWQQGMVMTWCIAAEHGSVSRICQVAPINMDPHVMHGSPSQQVCLEIQMASWSAGSAVFVVLLYLLPKIPCFTVLFSWPYSSKVAQSNTWFLTHTSLSPKQCLDHLCGAHLCDQHHAVHATPRRV